ncbi:hypothetical protein FKP32DRAFT_883856 [Trametes sanguinea]|nr:hypothetical protein FKP32DRAFT_883856 [Trametes sanguinea]
MFSHSMVSKHHEVLDPCKDAPSGVRRCFISLKYVMLKSLTSAWALAGVMGARPCIELMLERARCETRVVLSKSNTKGGALLCPECGCLQGYVGNTYPNINAVASNVGSLGQGPESYSYLGSEFHLLVLLTLPPSKSGWRIYVPYAVVHLSKHIVGHLCSASDLTVMWQVIL